ncbi:Zinc finger MYM-type protein 1 [Frankliniella fusca]|uniref:Zinc finger MYM-type protein 1 n=1 Tax=Frankliniella fusca TaxID=407009 RepID=A0AAE1HIH8_9NEOP|nr:Zinc finger MYM-type protein 1 [Frankliniella fusca]
MGSMIQNHEVSRPLHHLRLKEMQPLALFVHCFNHSLNLALQDTMKGLPAAREALKWVNDVGVIVHRSPKRKHALDQLRATFDEQGGPGPSSICPTRWTVPVRSIEGLLSSYLSVLTFLCDLSEQNTTEIIEDGKRVNISTKARGLHDQLEKGGVYFTILALRDVFSPCEELSKTLQSPSYTVSGAKQAVNLTLQKFKRMRSSDDHFETLWAEMEAAKEKYNLTEPTLPRCRNPPAQNEYNPSHTSAAHQFNAAKDKIRKEYFELLDLAISEINSRFDQDDFNKLQMMETALLTHPNDWGSDSKNIEDLLESYGFNVRKLKCNLDLMTKNPCKQATRNTTVGVVENRRVDAPDEGYNTPLIYCPLTRKDTKTYVEMLTFIKQLCIQACGVEPQPKTVLLDFEVPMHNTFRAVFQNAGVKACRFHLSQSLQRNLKTPELRNAFLRTGRHTPEVQQFKRNNTILQRF